MKTINLRWIYPHYRHDEFVEVSDEVWEAMRQAQREMNNYERRKVYHRAWYSLDAYSWAENYALEHGRSPERAERAELIRQVYEALATLTPLQARRIHARYISGLKVREIAAMEGVNPARVSQCIQGGLRRLRKYFERRKRTGGL